MDLHFVAIEAGQHSEAESWIWQRVLIPWAENRERGVMLAESPDRSGREVYCNAGKHVVAERLDGVIIQKQGKRIMAYRELIAVLQCERCEEERKTDKPVC
jgi:hypothetical protein